MIAEVGINQLEKPYFYVSMPDHRRLRIRFSKDEKRIALKLHKLINFNIVIDGYNSNKVNYDILKKSFK